MEYCGWGDLAMKIKRYIKRREYIDERVIWVYLIQILEGLKVWPAGWVVVVVVVIVGVVLLLVDLPDAWPIV